MWRLSSRRPGHGATLVFAGKLDKDVLGFAEKAIVAAFKAPDGDFRDWEEIRGWASGIAQELKTKV